MTTETKKKRQNSGSHMKNIRGSAFRKAWISGWLDDPGNKGKHYKDAVKAYIAYKTKIASKWAKPVRLLLESDEPCGGYDSYGNLLKASKDNVATVSKALTAGASVAIGYTENVFGDWVGNFTTGWMSDEDKYLTELLKPSGQTGTWMKKLVTLCADFEQIESEDQIVPGLERIIKHCTYTAGDADKNDKLPLYKYRDVHALYTEIARRLKKYSQFVENEIANGHENRITTETTE